jgi:hypothetical protein
MNLWAENLVYFPKAFASGKALVAQVSSPVLTSAAGHSLAIAGS